MKDKQPPESSLPREEGDDVGLVDWLLADVV